MDQAAPRRPRLALHVGVTGHRALPGTDPAQVRTTAAALFHALAAEIARLHQADQASPTPLFLPEPPQLRCIAGIASGADSLLAQAALDEGWTLVAALPFPQADFETDFAPADLDTFRALRARAATLIELNGDRARGGEPYAEVGRQIVEHADILLAVWDGLPPRGPGGTGDVVQMALDRAIPLAVLSPSAPTTLAWTGATDAAAAARTMLPAPDEEPFAAAYLQEPPRTSRWASTAVRSFERTMLLGTPPSPAIPTPEPPQDGRLAEDFAASDQLATAYAARYRAAGLLRYGLILPATVGAFLSSFGPDWAQPLGYLLQFAAVIAVIAFSTRGGWVHDQRRFIAYRALAEFLRNARTLLPFAAAPTPPEPQPYHARPADWTAWYGRAVLREVGLRPPLPLAQATSLVRGAATSQIVYLRSRSARFTIIANRLRKAGVALSLLGTAFIAGHAILAMAGASAPARLWFNQLALVLPAMAPVCLGLLSFGEYGRVSARYAAVATELEGLVARLDAAPPTRETILPVARRIADTLLAEAADWQLLVKSSTVHAF